MELTEKDKSGHLQFYGPFYDFQLDEIQTIPIKQVESGFLFNDEEFTQSTDAFFYLNDEATRLFTCRNATQVWHQYANYAAGYFPLYIFRGSEIYISGYKSNNSNEPRINHIVKMREPYFETDKVGIETFKAIYAQQNIEQAFDNKGFPLAELITEFKNSIKSEGFSY